MRTVIFIGLLFISAQSASAQTMNAESFLQKANALQKKGPLALLSMGRIKALAAEGRAAAREAREARLRALSQGKAPRYCPPANASQEMASSEFLNRLSAIPAAQSNRINMTEAMTRVLVQKFPCR